jgi:hypothetical protein
MVVPWRHKFRWQFERDGNRFYLRILCGVLVFYVARRWEWLPTVNQRHSQVTIGWIPLRVKEGGLLRVWSPYQRIYSAVQVIWGHN